MKKLLLILLCLPMFGFGQSQEVTLNGSQDSLIIEKYQNVNRTKTSEIIDGQVLTQTVYPVIFVHGLAGNWESWDGFNDFIDQLWSFGGFLDFCLNSFGNSNQDICNIDYEIDNLTSNLTNADYYVIDFDCDPGSPCTGGTRFSNQAAVIVQGRALGLAINDVLNVTQSEKVILVCHSMGGLAAREYIQNEDHWVNPSHHRVAKLVTSGTPHYGSNYTWGVGGSPLNGGADEQTEAVRDLRTSYFISGEDGAYLFGNGIYETTSDIKNSLLWNYYNVDVDCDGQPGEIISSGLNDISLPENLDYACIMGSEDDIVTSYSSNLSNISNSDKIEIFTCDDCHHSESVLFNNLYLTKNANEPVYQTFKALDEPDWFDLAYKVDLNQYYKGHLTYQDVDHPLGDYSVDYDDYYFVLNNPSSINISVSGLPPGAIADILDPNYNILYSGYVNGSGDINISTGSLSSGSYFLEIIGDAYGHPDFGSPPWINPYQFYIDNNSTALENYLPINGSLIKITDVLGRETKGTKNEVLFYIYDDGTVEKRIVIE